MSTDAGTSTFYPGLYYDDATAAIEWLCRKTLYVGRKRLHKYIRYMETKRQ